MLNSNILISIRFTKQITETFFMNLNILTNLRNSHNEKSLAPDARSFNTFFTELR